MTEIEALTKYKAEREAYGQHIKPPDVNTFKAKYAPIAKNLSRKLFEL